MTSPQEKTRITPNNPPLDIKRILFIGLGFMSAMIAWSFYNFKIPIILNGIKDGENWVRIGLLGTNPWMEIVGGVIMTLDNIIAVLLQPYFGSLSDRLESKYGRRTPFLLIGLPSAVFCLFIMPFLPSIFILMAVILCFNLAMAFYRSPIMALMPDSVPANRRSSANSFISLMGGVGTIIGVLIPKIVEIFPNSTPVATGQLTTQDFFWQDFWGFVLTGSFMLVCLLLFLIKIKEPSSGSAFFQLSPVPLEYDPNTHKFNRIIDVDSDKIHEKSPILETVREIFSAPEKSFMWISITQFFYVFGFNALEFSFGRYATGYFGIGEGTAGLIFSIIPVTLILSAIWVGRMGETVGRLKTMKRGLIIVITCIIIIIFLVPIVKPQVSADQLLPLWPLMLLLAIAGVGWGMISIQCLPVVWQLAPKNKIGAYTGIYYMVSALGAILSPPLMSSIYALTSHLGLNQWNFMFPYFLVCLIISFIAIQRVKRGDAEPLSKEELANLRNAFLDDD
jgi:MFS family permease